MCKMVRKQIEISTVRIKNVHNFLETKLRSGLEKVTEEKDLLREVTLLGLEYKSSELVDLGVNIYDDIFKRMIPSEQVTNELTYYTVNIQHIKDTNLYQIVFSGVSLDGTKFYVRPYSLIIH